MTIFAARGQELSWSTKEILQLRKKWKIENFEQNLCYVAQKKAKKIQNSDTSRKNKNF